MRVRVSRVKAAALLVSASIVSSFSAAQETEGLSEVVITARRGEERLQDVPLAVTALGENIIKELHFETLQDVRLVTPSLIISPSPLGPSQPGLTLRGHRASRSVIGQDPAVAVYVNDFVQTRPAGLLTSMYDMESIQVLNGPQGTLFGRNTTGGAILITPNGPTREFEGEAALSFGNYDLREYRAMLNVPASDTLMFRFAGIMRERDGYVKNLINGQDTFDDDSWAARAQMLWEPTANIENLTLVDGYEADTNGFLGHLRTLREGSGTWNVDGAVDSFQRIRAAGTLFVGESELELAERVENYGVINTTTVDLPGSKRLKNIIGYREVSTTSVIDHDGTAGDALSSTPISESKWWSEELQLSGENGRYSWITGLYYYAEEGMDEQPSRSYLPATSRAISINGGSGKNTSYSGFGHVTIDLDDWLSGVSVVAGARYTRDEREMTAKSRTITDRDTGETVCVVRDANNVELPGNACARTVKTTFNEPTYNIGLNWKITPDSLAYIVHRRGYRAGGFNVRARSPLDFTPFDPEIVTDVEIGFKNDFRIGDVSARTNIALYHQWYDDVQRNVTINSMVNGIPLQSSTVFNAAKAKLYGVELLAELEFTPSFSVRANYSYTENSYDEYLNPSDGTDLSDNRFPDTPRNQGSLSARYLLPLPNTIGDIATVLTWYAQSSFDFVDVNLPPYTVADGYSLLNASVTWDSVFGSNLSLMAFGSNLTDKEYVQAGTSSHSGFTGYTVVFPGAPRMYGLELSYRF